MFVEKTHLKTLWAYKAIQEEIKILHSRLVRIMSTIRKSEFSRHLLDEQDEEESKKLLSAEEEKITSSEDGVTREILS